MESVLNKGKIGNLSTGQYWLIFNGEKGMSDREGHGHKAVVYKSHFLPLRHSSCTETPIDSLANKPRLHTKTLFVLYAPTTLILRGLAMKPILKRPNSQVSLNRYLNLIEINGCTIYLCSGKTFCFSYFCLQSCLI